VSFCPMSESRVIDGEEFEGEEEEEVVEAVKEAPQSSAAVVDGEDEEEEEAAPKPTETVASDATKKEAGEAKEVHADSTAKKEEKPASEKAAASPAASTGSEKASVQTSEATGHRTQTKQYRSMLEQERTQKFREVRDRLYLNVGKQWSSIYAQISKELATASGSGLATSLSVTQDAAKALHSATSDIQKLASAF